MRARSGHVAGRILLLLWLEKGARSSRGRGRPGLRLHRPYRRGGTGRDRRRNLGLACYLGPESLLLFRKTCWDEKEGAPGGGLQRAQCQDQGVILVA